MFHASTINGTSNIAASHPEDGIARCLSFFGLYGRHVMWPVPFRMRCPYCRFPSLARFAQWSAATALRSLTTAALCLATIAARSAFARTHFRACPLINRRLRIGRSRILVSTMWCTAARVDEEAPMRLASSRLVKVGRQRLNVSSHMPVPCMATHST